MQLLKSGVCGKQFYLMDNEELLLILLLGKQWPRKHFTYEHFKIILRSFGLDKGSTK
jgi:hypothetical protein